MSFVVVNVDVCRVLVVMEFVRAVWNVVMGAATTKGFGEANIPFWKERVLAVRLEVVREDVMMDPWELSMVAFVN